MAEPKHKPRHGLTAFVGLILSAIATLSYAQSSAPLPPPSRAESDSYGLIHLPLGAHVLVLGDTYVGPPEALPGAKLKPSKKTKVAEPYTVLLAKLLGPQVTMTDQTRPGARVEQVLADFPADARADAVVVLLGPGDMWGGASPMLPAQFSNGFRRLLEKIQATGALVVAVEPPPVSAPKLDVTTFTAYRNVVGVQGGLVGANVLAFPPRFREISHLWTDGIHLDTQGSRAVARNIAAQFVPPTP